MEVLQIGSEGENVRQLQAQLNAQGYEIQVDGIFGEETRTAVIDFQESNGLETDGTVDPKTTKVLGTPRTQISQASSSSEVDQVDSAETVQKSGLGALSIKNLEEGYNIPTLETFNDLQNDLQSNDKDKQYRAAILLSSILTWQAKYKIFIEFYRSPKNLDICNTEYQEFIVVSIPDSENQSRLERFQQEKMPVDLILNVLDDMADQHPEEEKQLLAALFRGNIVSIPSEESIKVLKSNVSEENKKIDIDSEPIESGGGIALSKTEEAVNVLERISSCYPKELSNYLKNLTNDSQDFYKIIPYKKEDDIPVGLQLLENLAKSGDEEASRRLEEVSGEFEDSSNEENSSEDNSENIPSIEELSETLKDEEPLQKEYGGGIFPDAGFLLISEAPLCKLAYRGEPAIDSLKEVSQATQDLEKKAQIDLMISYLENPSVNYPYLVVMCSEGGGGSAIDTIDQAISALRKWL